MKIYHQTKERNAGFTIYMKLEQTVTICSCSQYVSCLISIYKEWIDFLIKFF